MTESLSRCVAVWLTVDHLNRVADGRKRPVPGNRHGKKVCGDGKRSGDGKGDYNTSEALGGYDTCHDGFVYGHRWSQRHNFSREPSLMIVSPASIAVTPAFQRFHFDHACLGAVHDTTAIYQN